MNTRLHFLSLIALLLPTLFLMLSAAHSFWQRAHAPIYQVVVEGVDPRDFVYGEYLQFNLLWDDKGSEKPKAQNPETLPKTARLFLPEGYAPELQVLLLAKRHLFTAPVQIINQKPHILNLFIDGKTWQEALAGLDENRNNSGL